MADVAIILTFKDAYVSRILASLTLGADTDMTLAARGSQDMPDGSDFSGSAQRRIAVQDIAGGETDKAFGKRYLMELLRLHVMMTESGTDQDRYDSDIAAVDPVTVDVPDGIVE